MNKPTELLYVDIIKEELIFRITSENGNLVKYKLEDITEIYSDHFKLKFAYKNEVIPFKLNEPKKVADYIVEKVLGYYKPGNI